MQEPIYDPERLKIDQHYRFNKIDELRAYMETIEPYSQRVEYFMNTTLALGFELRPLNMGSEGVYDKENSNGHKWWGLNDPANDADKALSRKLWFEKARHTIFPRFGQTTNETLEQRKARYFANSEGWNLTEYAKEQLMAIEAGISQFQAEYAAFIEGKGKLSHEPEQVQQQRLNAPALVRSELLGNPAINWLTYSRCYDLESFGILWDMVGFALFVKKQISNPTPSYKQEQTKATITNGNKRGPYNKPERDAVEAHFRSSVESAIEKELRNKREPNQERIVVAAYKQLTDKIKPNGDSLYNERTLRQHLPSDRKSELFGEIHRQVLKRITHLIK